jgi:hypothetical protein
MEQFSLEGDPQEDVAALDQLVTALSQTQDCIHSFLHTSFLPIRNHYTLYPYDTVCASVAGCRYDIFCEDTSCEIPEDTCLTWCEAKDWYTMLQPSWFSLVVTTSYVYRFYTASAEEECTSAVHCNWDSSLCSNTTDLAECQQLCSSLPKGSISL